LALLLVLACERERPLSAALATPQIRFEYAIFVLPPARAAVPRVPVKARVESIKRYPPPDVPSLRYFGRGISDAQAAALQKSTGAIVLTFAHDQKDTWGELRKATELTASVARATGGLIWDGETRELFTADEWERRRLSKWNEDVPVAYEHFAIHVYQDGDYVRAITLGMIKFGLPDVVMNRFPWGQQAQVGHTIQLVAQKLVEGQPLGTGGSFEADAHMIRNRRMREWFLTDLAAGGTGKARLRLREGEAEEGDPDNRLIETFADDYAGRDFHAKREAMLTALFGAEEDKVVDVRHDEKVLEASRRAREHLPALRKAFNAGLTPGETILLKAPFRAADGTNEWMWVEVSRWRGDAITGVLTNDPQRVKDLHSGQEVQIRESEVFDWMRRYPDGRTDGNTTAAVIYPDGG
jgi:uncharacterized protein YegJ (DUF2314 family)